MAATVSYEILQLQDAAAPEEAWESDFESCCTTMQGSFKGFASSAYRTVSAETLGCVQEMNEVSSRTRGQKGGERMSELP